MAGVMIGRVRSRLLTLALATLAGGAVLPARACDGAFLKVAVDVGHSRASPGATGASGRVEYDYNRRLARDLVELGQGRSKLRVFILNSNDDPISLTGRARLAAAKGAHAFLSIHHDSVHAKYMRSRRHGARNSQYTDAFHGFSLFVSDAGSAYEASRALATLIGRNLKDDGFTQTLHHAEPIANEGRRLLDWELGIYEAPFTVLKSARTPAVLFEAGVIANPHDETRLDMPDYRQRIATAILRALEAFCAARDD